MGKIARLFCHPPRVFVEEECNVLVKAEGRWNYEEGKKVIIPVDPLHTSQDPYVFHNPWLYGYCRNYNFPQETSKGSIIIFGTFLSAEDSKDRFLVDTVFVVGSRYNWVDKYGNEPSELFRRKYPYSTDEKWYKDFIAPRVELRHHPKAKAIFEAVHTDRSDYEYKLQEVNWQNMFSFIPLKFNGEIYELIDICPLIDEYYPNIFDNFNKQRNRLYDIELNVFKFIDHVLEKADHLIVNTTSKGSPDKPNMNLQQNYYRDIYNIYDEKEVWKCCKDICKYIPSRDDE